MYEWRLPCYRTALLSERAATMADSEFGHLEHLHYGGELACEEWVQDLVLNSDDFVLDLGCGVGGTERFLFREVGCRYLGLDVRRDFVEFAQRRSNRTKRFVVHDIREPWREKPTVILAVLSLGRLDHIYDVLQNVFGSFDGEARFLFEIVAEQDRVSRCLDQITAYETPHYLDCTDNWGAWALERTQRLDARYEEFESHYGAVLTNERKRFYNDVSQKFGNGEWIGMRISSSKIVQREWDVKKMTILEFETDENRTAKG